MNSADHIERAIREFRVTTKAETDRHILDDAFAAFETSARREAIGLKPSIWRSTVLRRVAAVAAVAAAILIVFSVFFRTPPAKALTLAQVSEALAEVRNVCVLKVAAPDEAVKQRVFSSQDLGLVLFQTERMSDTEFVLWDVRNKLSKQKYQSRDAVRTERPSDEVLARFKEYIDRNLELVPFSGLTQAPDSHQWDRVQEPEVAATVPGTEVYDLTWPDRDAKSSSITGLRKWRVFTDIRTNLPRRMEHYWKQTGQEQYQLEGSEVVTYPTESEIMLLIKDIFGPDDGRSQEPGYIGTPEHYLPDPVRKK
jgi:hypothetical protein